MKLLWKIPAGQPTLADFLLIRGIDAAQLARDVGLSPRIVRDWANGSRSPQAAKARVLAAGLGIDMDTLCNLLAATRDAVDESQERRAVRTAFAALSLIESRPKDRTIRANLTRLAARAERAAKRLKLILRRKPGAA